FLENYGRPITDGFVERLFVGDTTLGACELHQDVCWKVNDPSNSDHCESNDRVRFCRVGLLILSSGGNGARYCSVPAILRLRVTRRVRQAKGGTRSHEAGAGRIESNRSANDRSRRASSR